MEMNANNKGPKLCGKTIAKINNKYTSMIVYMSTKFLNIERTFLLFDRGSRQSKKENEKNETKNLLLKS